LFGYCIIYSLYTECAKIKKKKFRRQKVNGRYTDCLSLTYATNKGKMLKLRYKY